MKRGRGEEKQLSREEAEAAEEQEDREREGQGGGGKKTRTKAGAGGQGPLVDVAVHWRGSGAGRTTAFPMASPDTLARRKMVRPAADVLDPTPATVTTAAAAAAEATGAGGDGEAGGDRSQEFFRHVRKLNESFAAWFKDQVAKDGAACLVAAAQDYVDYAARLEETFLRRSGEVLTFGSGDCGQLAHGVEDDRDLVVSFPRVVYSLRDKAVCSIACGGLHNAVTTRQGLVYTWGCNDDGALGRPGEENTPFLVEGLLRGQEIVRVACGDSHTLALSVHGEVFGWGCFKSKEGIKYFTPAANAGNASAARAEQRAPVRVPDLAGVIDIQCGASFNVARGADGSLYSWGLGECGELSRDACEIDKKTDPARVLREHLTPGPMLLQGTNQPARDAKCIACGSWHALIGFMHGADTAAASSDAGGRGGGADGASANRSAGNVGGNWDVLSVGLNNYGQLGYAPENHENASRLRPVPALQDLGISQLVGGHHHSLALSERSGDVYAWGRADSGQLGTAVYSEAGAWCGEPRLVAMPENMPGRVRSIAAGANHNLALTTRSDVYTWGYGDMSALGHGQDDDEHLPRKLNFKKAGFERLRIQQLDGGGQHSAILTLSRSSAPSSSRRKKQGRIRNPGATSGSSSSSSSAVSSSSSSTSFPSSSSSSSASSSSSSSSWRPGNPFSKAPATASSAATAATAAAAAAAAAAPPASAQASGSSIGGGTGGASGGGFRFAFGGNKSDNSASSRTPAATGVPAWNAGTFGRTNAFGK